MRRSRQSSSQFGAPWGRGIKIVTWSVIVLISGVAIILPLAVPRKDLWVAVLIPGSVLLILGITALFCVRGYTVRQRELWIHRSFWQTRMPLKDLRRAYADAKAMHKCIRSCGNGGFMGVTGWFYNKKLGNFRAFITDPARSVVLEFAKRRVVVSPDDPRAFVRALGFNPEAQRSVE
ncbi:MAG: hypothetical protein IH623_30060 [Verrucomicrobia bacterium]|nr:hypothetical protein [Verrucomicrobiota bacterium]